MYINRDSGDKLQDLVHYLAKPEKLAGGNLANFAVRPKKSTRYWFSAKKGDLPNSPLFEN